MNSISKAFERFENRTISRDVSNEEHFIIDTTNNDWNQLKSEIQGHTDYLEELIHGLNFQIDNLMDMKHQSEKQLKEKDKEIERLNKEIKELKDNLRSEGWDI